MEYSGITLSPGFIISAATDPQFNYVTALLHGDGTNTGQNNTFLDSSPNNFTVTRSGTPTQGSFAPFGTLWSNYFPGSSNLLFPFNAAFNLPADFTIEFWAYRVSGGGMPLNCGGGSNIAWASYEFNYDGNNINFAASSANNGYDIGSESGATGSLGVAPYNTWNHIAVTRTGNVYRGFINGVQGYTQTLALAPYSQTTRGLSIGGNYSGTWGTGTPTSGITGYLSNVRIVKGTSLYTANFTPPTQPLTAITNTSVLTCQSSYLKDNSTNNLTITPTGTASAQVFSPFGTTIGYQPAVIGGSGLFGVADYLQLPTTSAFQFGTNNFTIECWVYLNSAVTAAQRTIWYNYVSSFTTDSIFFGGHAAYSGRITFWAFNVNNSAPVLLDPTALTPYVWTHIAVVRSGTSFNLYRNGVSVSNATSSASVVGPTWTTGGYIGTSGTSSLDGYISDFRMVNGTAVYTANFTPPTAPLSSIGNTSLLLSGTNGQVFDNAMMNNLVTVGTAQISTSVVKYGTGSIFINGSGNYLTMPSSPNLSFGTGDFTIEGWMNLSSATGAYRTIVSIPHSSGKLIVRFGNSASYNSYFQVSTLATAAANVYSTNQTQTALLNQWVHFAFTRSSSTCRVFLNGVLQNIGTGAPATSFVSNTFSDSTNITNNATVVIGEEVGTDTSFIGYLDEFRITKGIARYTSNFLPPPSIFPSTGNIPVITPTVEYLVVAGGGGGGWSNGGGGGAGGYRTNTGLSVTAGSAITVTIGTGGAGSGSGKGSNGTNSVFGSITSTGGGGGGSAQSQGGPGNTGGSGGGGGNDYPRGTDTAGGAGNSGGYTPAEGKNGGASQGGGGGASTAGSNGATNGVGGAGAYSSITGASVARGGGGGGSTESATDPVLGGVGGGGNGQKRNSTAPGNGTVNTGGGGGGGANSTGGTGGSGVVIIRYTNDYLAATSTTGSPTVTNTGGYWIYAWTSSGSITF